MRLTNLLPLLATGLAGLAAANPLPDAHGSDLTLDDLVVRRDAGGSAVNPHARRHPPAAAPPEPLAERNFYSMVVNVTVKKCDTLTSIAHQYGSGACDVFNANRGVLTNPNFIADGAVLQVPVNVPHPDDTSCLPAKAAPFVPGPGQTLNPDGSLNYTVVAGDTLTIIATKFNSGICDIAKRNNLPDPNAIDVKQVLAVPLNVMDPDNTSCLPACVPDGAATSRRDVFPVSEKERRDAFSHEKAAERRDASSPGKTAARRDA